MSKAIDAARKIANELLDCAERLERILSETEDHLRGVCAHLNEHPVSNPCQCPSDCQCRRGVCPKA